MSSHLLNYLKEGSTWVSEEQASWNKDNDYTILDERKEI